MLMAFFMLTACDKGVVNLNLNIEPTEISFVVEPTTATGEIIFTEKDVYINLDSIITAANDKVKTDRITSAKLQKLTFEIDPSSNATFDLVKSVSAKMGLTTGDLVTIAEKDPMPTGGLKTVDVDVNDAEIVDFLKATNFKFDVRGVLNGPINEAIPMKARMTIKITYKAL